MSQPPITVVCFHTNAFYQARAMRLAASCERFGIAHSIEALTDQGSWVENCALKSEFILRKLSELDTHILWIDADAIVRQPIHLLLQTTADFAVRAEEGERIKRPAGRESIHLPTNWPADLSPRWFNSGTLYFKNNDRAKSLCQRWTQLRHARPRDWDQWTLQQAWCDIQPNTEWLPQSYCHIQRMHPDADQAVIAHELASTIQKVNRS